MTQNFDEIRGYVATLDPKWKYGLLISNFAEASVLKRNVGWELGFGRNNNTVSKGSYGPWFTRDCKNLYKACSVYGNQGLELDCPIVIFGGDYIRRNGRWVSQGWQYDNQRGNYSDPDTIVENNYRVLLTRARKEMILFIPNHPSLNETYQYFVNMGMEVL